MSADADVLEAPESGPLEDLSPAGPDVVGRLWRQLRRSGLLLAAPALVLLTLLFFLPLLRIVWQSFNEHPTLVGGPEHFLGIGNYKTLFTDGYTVRILIRTLIIGLIIAAVTGLFAYPYAYMMTIVGPRTRAILVTLVLVPLWTSNLARSFAWVVLLQAHGPVDNIFHVVLKGTPVAVTLAMGQVLLPFMVLPMDSGRPGIDRNLLSAGESLGPTGSRHFAGSTSRCRCRA